MIFGGRRSNPKVRLLRSARNDNVYPSFKEFLQLSKRGNVIPVYREILADFETPLSAYLKLEEDGPAYLLESVEQGEQLGRYSFLGSTPGLILQTKGREVEVRTRKGQTKRWTFDTNPLEALERLLSSYRWVKVPGLPRFSGGFVGYLGYDAVRFLEPVGPAQSDPLHLPESVWLLSDSLVIFDHIEHRMKVVANAIIPDGVRATWRQRAHTAYQDATKRIDALVATLRQPLPPYYFSTSPSFRPSPPRGGEGKVEGGRAAIRSNMSRGDFFAAVRRAKEAISQGETIQTVLSQRFETPITCEPFDIYRALRSLNPSPYMFYLNLGSFFLIGSSPEILVRCEDGLVETRPIAGTRPRGKTSEADLKIEEELRKDPKERAEHLMLADLGRNDIGRVCEYGSVKVNELMTVERYSHVMHLVSDVTGKLRRDKSAFDLFRAAFPAGTVTGAPKVRAMQIIRELEPDARGPYAGAVGYVSFSGNLDTCITIRTILVKGKKAYVQAGAGIVADSKPDREYQETRSKAAGMLEAIRLAESGLV